MAKRKEVKPQKKYPTLVIPHSDEDKNAERLREKAEPRIERINTLFKQSGWTEAYKDVFYVLNRLKELRMLDRIGLGYGAGSSLPRNSDEEKAFYSEITKRVSELPNNDEEKAFYRILPQILWEISGGDDEEKAFHRAMAQIARENLLPVTTYNVVEQKILYPVNPIKDLDPEEPEDPDEVWRNLAQMEVAITQLSTAVEEAIEKGNIQHHKAGFGTGARLRGVIDKILRIENPGKGFTGAQLALEIENAGCTLPSKDSTRRGLISRAISELREGDPCFKSRPYRYQPRQHRKR